MWDLKDFSEEQAVELFRTNKGLINNYKKTTTTADHPGNNMGWIQLLFSLMNYVNVLYVNYLIQDITK